MYFSSDVIPAAKLGFSGTRALDSVPEEQLSMTIIEESPDEAYQYAPNSFGGLLLEEERVAEREAVEAWLKKMHRKSTASTADDVTPRAVDTVTPGARVTLLPTEPTVAEKRFGDPSSDCDLEDLFEGVWIKSNPRNALNEIVRNMGPDVVVGQTQSPFYVVSVSDQLGGAENVLIENNFATTSAQVSPHESGMDELKQGGLWKKLSDYLTALRMAG